MFIIYIWSYYIGLPFWRAKIEIFHKSHPGLWYGESGHLSFFHFFEALLLWNFSGHHFYTLSQTLLACRAMQLWFFFKWKHCQWMPLSRGYLIFLSCCARPWPFLTQNETLDVNESRGDWILSFTSPRGAALSFSKHCLGRKGEKYIHSDKGSVIRLAWIGGRCGTFVRWFNVLNQFSLPFHSRSFYFPFQAREIMDDAGDGGWRSQVCWLLPWRSRWWWWSILPVLSVMLL